MGSIPASEYLNTYIRINKFWLIILNDKANVNDYVELSPQSGPIKSSMRAYVLSMMLLELCN